MLGEGQRNVSLPFIGTLCGLIVPFRPFKDFSFSLKFSPFLLYIVRLLFNVLTICQLVSTFKPDYPIFSIQGPVRTFPKNLLFQLGIIDLSLLFVLLSEFTNFFFICVWLFQQLMGPDYLLFIFKAFLRAPLKFYPTFFHFLTLSSCKHFQPFFYLCVWPFKQLVGPVYPPFDF
jgi:hypothetical protein